jgi:hypothetical protein
MTIRYEIDESNVVTAFAENSEIPLLRAANWPNGDAWADKAEAIAWVELWIAEYTDESAPLAPTERGKTGRPKLTAEEKAIIQELHNSLVTAAPEERQAIYLAIRQAYEANY